MRRYAVILISVCMLAACTEVGEGIQKIGEGAKNLGRDTRNAWEDVLTYKRPADRQAPQRRFCYQFASDIVCYAEEQPNMTAKLVGIQEGSCGRIIAGEPGMCGSTGAMGEESISVVPNGVSNTTTPLGTPFGADTTRIESQPAGGTCGEGQPFHCVQSPFVPNADVGR